MVIKGNEIRYHIQPITGIYVGTPQAVETFSKSYLKLSQTIIYTIYITLLSS